MPLNACVIRYWHEKKQQDDYIVLVTTDEALDAKWIIRHYEERPEIEQDYEQMKSGGWHLKKLSSRASKKAFYPSIFGARDLGLMHLSLRHQYLGQLIGFSA